MKTTFIFLGYILFLVSIATSSINLLCFSEIVLIPLLFNAIYNRFKKVS